MTKIGMALFASGLLSTSALVPAAACAQAAADVAKQPTKVDEVVVTGSRITSDGYQTPTPVTVANIADLTKAAPTSVLTGLNQLPQFTGSVTNDGGAHNSPTSPTSGNILNLRALGGIRTLILMDGQRVPPTTFQGTVDADIIPQMLVQRVDVVTAGASAAYGSDAVAGVVNFVLDQKFTGLKVAAQGGISSRSDYKNYRIGAAYGKEIGDRAHLLLSADYYRNDGFLKTDRPALFDNGIPVGSVVGGGAPGTKANPLVDASNVRFNFATYGGIVGSGPFAGTVFLANGSFRPVVQGTPTGSAGYFFGGDLAQFPADTYQSAPIKNASAFGRFSYDVTDSVTAYLQVNAARTDIYYNGTTSFQNGKAYFAGNPFIPAALAQQLATTNTPSFTLSRQWVEAGRSPTDELTEYYNVATGLNGELAGYHWNVGYQRSAATMTNETGQFYNDKFAAAADAVLDSTGKIVCRPTLDPDPAIRSRYAGCVPINPFGLSTASQAALNYVTGTSWYRALNQSNEINATVSGDLFKLWAGPVSAAVGLEYRNQSLKIVSNSDPTVPVDTTGLRGIAATTTRFSVQNFGTGQGKFDVKEGFAEISVPLVRDIAIAKSLDVNGAVRFTDYSTSGNVTTWKAGGVWALSDDIRFRLTRSRDIRAPTLFDLFSKGTNTLLIFLDPHTNIQNGVTFLSRGNPDVKPEQSDTLSVGVVLQPRTIPGFSISADYYDVKLLNAIQSTSPAIAAKECETSGGTSPACGLINRPRPFSDRSAANFPTSVLQAPANIAGVWTNGVDIEASYRTALGRGFLTSRFIANYVDSYRTQSSPSQPVIEYAGWTEGNNIPKFKATLQVDYTLGELGLFVQERLIGKLKRGPVNVWAEPDLPSVLYTDMTVTYKFGSEKTNHEAFITINNMFDKKAPYITGGPGPGLQLNTLTYTYDVVGRAFNAGVRLSF